MCDRGSYVQELVRMLVMAFVEKELLTVRKESIFNLSVQFNFTKTKDI